MISSQNRDNGLMEKLGGTAEANANESNFRDERTNPTLGEDQHGEKKRGIKGKDPNSITNLDYVHIGDLDNART